MIDLCERCSQPAAFSTSGLCVSCYEVTEEQPHPETLEGASSDVYAPVETAPEAVEVCR